MLHWYFLAKECIKREKSTSETAPLGLVCGGGPNQGDVEFRNVSLRFFILGAIEASPLAGGVVAGNYFEQDGYFYAPLIIGFLVCFFLCWMFRNQTPSTIIHAVESGAAEE